MKTMLLSENTNRNSKIILLITAFLLISFLVYTFWDVITILMLSVLLGIIVNPLVKFIERRGFSRLTSVIIIYLLLGIIFYVSLAIIIPKIINQFNTILSQFNSINIEQIVKDINESIDKYFPVLSSINFSEQLTNVISSNIYNSVKNIGDLLTGIFNIVSIMFIVPFITFFLLKDHKSLVKSFLNILPNKYFEMGYYVFSKMKYSLSKYVVSWILDAALVAIMSIIGLSILGIENSIIIGIIAGLGHLIPFFGPIIGGLPAIAISLIQFGDFSMFFPIVILFVIIYTFDNGFIQPNLFSKSTEMHPLIIILLIILGSKLFGVIGMLLIVPIVTLIKTATQEIYYGIKNYKLIKS